MALTWGIDCETDFYKNISPRRKRRECRGHAVRDTPRCCPLGCVADSLQLKNKKPLSFPSFFPVKKMVCFVKQESRKLKATRKSFKKKEWFAHRFLTFANLPTLGCCCCD
jgi:hypothetical protein